MTIPITSCPTCSRILGTTRAARYHHIEVHGVSLRDVPVDDWPEYLADRDDIQNPEGEQYRDRERADRHPIYRENP